MAKTPLPYQCLAQSNGSLLIGASGSNIDLFRTSDGTFLSSWACHADEISEHIRTPTDWNVDGQHMNEEGSPPAKKQKISILSEIEASKSASKDNKKKRSNRVDYVVSGLETPAVTALASTSSGKYVVAVTGEDKSIRVLEITSDGGAEKLQQISKRAMPKRPCALAITEDDSTILSADKFGDVYSLPLLHSEISESSGTSISASNPAPEVALVPAANEKTIHSQRNRKALENQKRNTNQKTEKSGPKFEHKLLLGHVSMLTDIQLAHVDGRGYIISADRDEHIRVSRGMPHTHVIEGFCLGHSDFVSRLCVPRTRPEILISGGGENDLLIWDWRAGRLLSRTNLASRVAEAAQATIVDQELAGQLKIVVSGICHVHDASQAQDFVIVTCEGTPALYNFTLTARNELAFTETLGLPGNVLDVVARLPVGAGDSAGAVVSIDTIHQAGSKTLLRNENEHAAPALLSFTYAGTKLVECGKLFNQPSNSSGDLWVKDTAALTSKGRLTNLLYKFENLRKRGDDEGQEE